MIFGLILFIMGLIILVYPQVLVIMIAASLMLAGSVIMGMSLRWRRVRHQTQSRFTDLFFRF